MIKPLLAAAEERWLVPVYSSPRARAWIAAHGCLTLPFLLRGEIRRYEWTLPTRRIVLTIGVPRRLQRFCQRLLGPLIEAGQVGSRAIWNPESLAAAAPDADLVVVEIHRWAAARFRRAGWLIVPDVVRWQNELAFVPPLVQSRSLQADLGKVQRYGYRLAPGSATADWQEFYATMVVPQARQRFGEAAWIPSPTFMRALRKVATLQFIYRETERVAGFCLVARGDRVWCPISAIRGGDERLRREGVLAAVYALGTEWAKTHGYRYIDQGRTSSFVNDGIADYKRKWGLQPTPDPLSRLFAVKLGDDPSVAEAFAREPVLLETAKGLVPYAGRAA